MHLQGFGGSLWRRVGWIASGAIAIVSLVLSGNAHAAANAATTGIQFDEVTRFVSKDANPQPGTFSADYQAALSAAQQQAADANSAQQHHGLFSGINQAVKAMKSAAELIKSGAPSTHYALGQWGRVDNPADQTAVISKPDQHQIIYLNLGKKTYRIVDTTVSSAPMPPPGAPQNSQPVPPPPPGTGKLDVSVSNAVLGPKTVENVATTGYSRSFKSALTNSTGSCKDGSFQTSLTQYLSNYPDSSASVTTGPSPNASSSWMAAHPESAGVPGGCRPTIRMHTSGRGSAPSGRLSMWTLIALGGAVQTQAGQAGGKLQTLIERGNLRVLGAGDKRVFDIPAGFSKETPAP